MPTVFDVAAYILEKVVEVSAMKLQKLVYYSQAWSLVWDELELFPEPIEAWRNGPVVPALYESHKGIFKVNQTVINRGSSDRLLKVNKETVDIVLSFYGDKSAQWLSDLTHVEDPWKNARLRAHAGPGEPCNEVITAAEMAEYYSGIPAEAASVP